MNLHLFYSRHEHLVELNHNKIASEQQRLTSWAVKITTVYSEKYLGSKLLEGELILYAVWVLPAYEKLELKPVEAERIYCVGDAGNRPKDKFLHPRL